MCAANLIVFGLRLINQTCQFCYMLNISMWKTQSEEDLLSVAALFLKWSLEDILELLPNLALQIKETLKV